MSQTNIEYLFQVIAPAAGRPLNAARNSDDFPAFGDHLSQASAPSTDVSRPSDLGVTSNYSTTKSPPSAATNDRDQRPSDAEPTSSAKRDDDGDTISAPPPAQDEPVENQAAAETATGGVEDNPHDTDNTDDADAAGLTNAVHATGHDTPHKTVEAKQKSDGDLAKMTNNTDPASKPTANRVAKVVDKSQETESKANDPTAEVVAVGADANEIEIEPAADVCQATTAGECAPATNESKDGKQTSASHATAKADAAEQADKQRGKRPATENNQPTNDAAEPAAAQLQVSANAAAKGQNQTADDDDSSADSRRGSKTTTCSSSRSDAAAQVNKAELTAVANAVAVNVAETLANADAPGDANDQAVKPVTAKSAPAVASLTRATRTSTETSRASRTANSNDMPRVDPARFVGRVAKAFQMAHERGGTLQLRLSPPELGALRVELTVKDGVMSAALETDNANARRLLLDHLPALRDRLAEQNIRVERFDVDVRRDGSGGQTDPRGANQHPQHQSSDRPEPRRQPSGQQRIGDVAPQDVQVLTQRISSNGINLIV